MGGPTEMKGGSHARMGPLRPGVAARSAAVSPLKVMEKSWKSHGNKRSVTRTILARR